MRLHFCGVDLFTCNVDYVGDPTDDFEPGTGTDHQVVGNKDSITQCFFIWLREIAIAYSTAAHVNLTRCPLWIYEFEVDAVHRFTNEPFVPVCCLEVIAN